MQVTHHAEVDEFEDRRLVVLVDGDDRLGGLHACSVLDGPRDPGRDVELRRHGLPRLADLVGVRVPAGVDRSPRRPDRSAQGVGERLDRLEVAPGAPTARHDDGRLGQLGSSRRLARPPLGDLRGARRVADLGSKRFDGCRALSALRRDGVGLHGDDGRAVGDLGRHRKIAGEDGLHGHRAVVGRLDVDGVGDQPRLRLHGQPRSNLLTLRAGRDEHGSRRCGGDQLGQRLCLRHDQVVGVVGAVEVVDLLGAVTGQRLTRVIDATAEVDGRGGAEPPGQGE